MTPEALLARRAEPVRLVIFDCDGVLVDSEGIANNVTARLLSGIGWRMTPVEADRQFLGMSLTDMIPVIEAHLGHAVPPHFADSMVEGILADLAANVRAIPGAVESLYELERMGVAWRIASNSSHAEMAVKFAAIGITSLAAGRIHSFLDVPRGKPAPDLFLAAAAAGGAHPRECLVIEDSVVGATAAAAAGMDCLGYAPHTDGAHLRRTGAVPFASMFELPGLLGLGIAA